MQVGLDPSQSHNSLSECWPRPLGTGRGMRSGRALLGVRAVPIFTRVSQNQIIRLYKSGRCESRSRSGPMICSKATPRSASVPTNGRSLASTTGTSFVSLTSEAGSLSSECISAELSMFASGAPHRARSWTALVELCGRHESSPAWLRPGPPQICGGTCFGRVGC